MDTSMTKAEAENILQDLKDSISLDEKSKKNGIKCVKAAEKFQKSNTYTKTLIESVKLPQDSKPKLTTEAMTAITNCLKDKESTQPGAITSKQAIKTFSDALTDLDKKIKSGTVTPNSVVKKVQELRNDLLTSMETQHQIEMTALKKLFDDQLVLDSNGNSTQITITVPPQAINDVRTPILNALKKSQEEQCKSFTTDVNKELTRMHKLSNRSEAVLLLCDDIYKDGRHKSFTKNLISQNKQHKGNIQVQNATEDSDRFSGADFKNLEYFKTQSGKKIPIKRNTEDGTITGLSINSSVFGFRINSKDLLDIALLGKAMGWEKIKMDITHSDPEKAIELAREAYIACLKAGFCSIKELDAKGNPTNKEIGIVIRVRDEKGNLVEKDAASLGIDPSTIESLLTKYKETNHTPAKNTVAQYKEELNDIKPGNSENLATVEPAPIQPGQ